MRVMMRRTKTVDTQSEAAVTWEMPAIHDLTSVRYWNFRFSIFAFRVSNPMPQLSKNTQSTLSEINMVPFIDVVLVLLIIFMITAPILQSGIEVDVPKTKTVKEINEPRLVITIDKNQLIYLADVPVNINQLGTKVRAQLKKPQDSVFLRADETIPFGTFAKVIDALRQSGVSNIEVLLLRSRSRNAPVLAERNEHRRLQLDRIPLPPTHLGGRSQAFKKISHVYSLDSSRLPCSLDRGLDLFSLDRSRVGRRRRHQRQRQRKTRRPSRRNSHAAAASRHRKQNRRPKQEPVERGRSS